MENLEIIETTDISIEEMVSAQASGISVVRSAHVGNLRPYNLALAANGMNMLLVDHNMTGVDSNYRPQSVIESGSEENIAQLNRLSCRTRTISGEWVDDFHIDSLVKALPQTKVVTNTGSVQSAPEIVDEIVGIATRIMPDIFRRVALEDGTVEVNENVADSLKLGMEIMQLMDDPRAEKKAVLLPNVIDIVKDFVIELLKTGNSTLIHISGPDMVSYLGFNKDGTPKEARQQVTRLFDEILKSASFRELLPPFARVLLVPSTAARFVTTQARKDAMDNLLETVSQDMFDDPIASIKAERSAFAQTTSKKDEGFKKKIAGFVLREKSILQRVFDASMEVPELFVGPKDSGFLTQYDLIKEGGIYVPELTTKSTMVELELIFKNILQARKSKLT